MPNDGTIQLDEKRIGTYKILTWKIDKAVAAPIMGIDVRQKWPYAPYYQMTVSLQYGARDAALFLCLAALTLLILGDDPHLGRLALLAGLFALPGWVLMAGGAPLPASVTPVDFAAAQVRALPALALAPLGLALFVLRGQPGASRTSTALVLLLMALLMLGHPLLELLPDEPKRKAIQNGAQIGLAGYTLALALFTAARVFFRRWLSKRRAQKANNTTGGGDVQNEL